MTFQRTVAFKLSGPVDQPTLNALRERLQLKPAGRLTDDWDEIFGRRVIDTDNGRVKILLVRDTERPGWKVSLHVDGEPAEAAVRSVEAEVKAAATTCGLVVESTLRLPAPHRTANPEGDA